MIKYAILSLVLVVGCGGKATAPKATDEHAGHDEHAEHHPEGEHHAHGAEGTPVAAFHDVLAPLWHAEDGPKRVTDTCNAAGQLHGLANNIVTGGAPAGAAPDYLDAANGLVAAVEALHVECETAERKDFTAKFVAVHEAFHKVAERAGQ